MAARALSEKAKGKRRGEAAVAWVFGVVFTLAGGVAFAVLTVKPIAGVYQARGWPAVPCTVVSSRVTTHSDSDGTTYGVEIEYRYEVDGRSYTSDRRAFSMSGSSSGRSGKQRFVDAHPPGKAMTCYVDPDDPATAVLDKGLTWSFLWALFPLPFLLVGLGALWVAARGGLGRGPSRGAKSAGARPDTGAVPSADAGGGVGPVVLRPGRQRLGGAVGLLVFGLIWNGIVGVFVVHLVGEYRRGDPQVCPSLFMVPFVLVGAGVVVAWVRQVMLVFAPVIELELDRAAVPVGGAVALKWRVPGRRGRLTSMTIDLVGEEKATYRRGTDTVTDTHMFFERRLAGAGGGGQSFDTLPAVPDRGSVVVSIPAEAMHTFKAGNNKIEWSLRVRGEVPRWPDPKDSYELTVLPMRLGG